MYVAGERPARSYCFCSHPELDSVHTEFQCRPFSRRIRSADLNNSVLRIPFCQRNCGNARGAYYIHRLRSCECVLVSRAWLLAPPAKRLLGRDVLSDSVLSFFLSDSRLTFASNVTI